jgi:hypothetical protein
MQNLTALPERPDVTISLSATVCRCCGQPLEARTSAPQIQTNSKGQSRIIPAMTVLSCTNRCCGMWMQTFDPRDYADIDLGLYLKKAVR